MTAAIRIPMGINISNGFSPNIPAIVVLLGADKAVILWLHHLRPSSDRVPSDSNTKLAVFDRRVAPRILSPAQNNTLSHPDYFLLLFMSESITPPTPLLGDASVDN